MNEYCPSQLMKVQPRTMRALGFAIVLSCGITGAALAEPTPLSISRESDLSFGSFVVINTASVTVEPTGQTMYNNAFVVSGGQPTPATFLIQGEPNAEVRIDLPFGELPSTVSGLTARFKDFRAAILGDTPTDSSSFLARLSPTGRLEVSVGGKVDISRSSGSGTLSVAVPLSVAYAN